VEEEETALESYETPLDKDDSAIDEYQVFKSVLESKKSNSCIYALLGVYVLATPLPSIRQCLSYEVVWRIRGKIIRTVLCCIV